MYIGIYRVIHLILPSFWLWRWNWGKGGLALCICCQESTFTPKQANAVVALKHILSNLKFFCYASDLRSKWTRADVSPSKSLLHFHGENSIWSFVFNGVGLYRPLNCMLLFQMWIVSIGMQFHSH